MISKTTHISASLIEASNKIDQPTVHHQANEDESLQNVAPGEDILVVDEKDLKDVTKFEQIYLISKILGVTMPIKTITAKMKWTGNYLGKLT